MHAGPDLPKMTEQLSRRRFLRRATAGAAGHAAAGLVAACGNSVGTGAKNEGEQGAAARGQPLFTQLGCNSCHNVNGQPEARSALNGLYNSSRKLANGETVIADEEYLRAAILEPDAQIAEGYQAGVMSLGIARGEDRMRQGNTTDALIEYIKSLK